MKGLIIAEPWLDLILSGWKTWEMRKGPPTHRGVIGLVRRGADRVVAIARLTQSLPAIDDFDDYARAERFHRIEPDRQFRAFSEGWRTPWVFTDVRPLPEPVPIQRPESATVWLNLHPSVAARIRSLTQA